MHMAANIDKDVDSDIGVNKKISLDAKDFTKEQQNTKNTMERQSNTSQNHKTL